MKRTKLLLAMLFVMILTSLTACGGHLHAMGDWEIGTAPTWEEEGVYVQKCEGCDAYITQAIPALKDTSVWTLTETVEPDHANTGKMVYTSTYGEVTVVLAVVPHEFGDVYTLINEPTADSVGKASHVCECGAVEEVEVPALSNADVWAVETVSATHFEEGTNTYTSIYGTVVVEIPVVPHVYGDYTITVAPTMDTVGKATHACECEHVEEVDVPALSNTEVWAVETVSATHFEEGTNTYTSIYGTVVVAIPVVPHVYGDYYWVTEATLTSGGVVAHACECEHVEEVEVPALTDSAYTKEETVKANYNEGGKDTYTHAEYGVTAEVAVAKLVAPYDGKTYNVFHVDADDRKGVISAENRPENAFIELNANGVGENPEGAQPFRGGLVFRMVDSQTGEIQITKYDSHQVTVENEDGSTSSVYVVDWEEVEKEKTVYTAWVDFENGFIVTPSSTLYNDYNSIHVYTPFGYPVKEDVKASAWGNAIAIEYAVNGETYSIFVNEGNVYFGVSFVDLEGNNVSANECYSQANVSVLDKNGNAIVSFAASEGELVVADGKQGNYVNGSDTLYVSGAGVAVYNGVSGTYTVNGDAIGVYVNGEYYDVTLSGSEFEAVKTMVAITFDAGEYATVEAVTVNKNIAITLPAPTSETHTFKGWKLNGEFVADPYVPTENVTLVAEWGIKVIINLVGVVEGDASVLTLAEGDILGDYLPVYTINDQAKVFLGWYLDDTFETALPEEVELAAEDSGITIYAKWTDLPIYSGTYYGSEIWNASYGNNGGLNLTIDENGNISGKITGTVVSYDPATQVVQWTPNNGTTIYKFYFNAELGVIAGIYSNYDINNDFYFFFKDGSTNGKVNAHYGIKAAKSPSNVARDYYAHFINANTDMGEREIFIYNNYIYSDFTAVDGNGNPVTAANVKDSKIVVVKDANGNIIVSVASTGASFAAQSTTVDLDEYFGSYACGDQTVVLDGVGGIVYGDKTGTYTKVEGKDYGFDVYFGNNEEYYRLTLNGDSCTMVKPMVTVTLNGGAYGEDAAIEVNVNIAYVLPTLEHESNVFNGWFYDEACTQPVGDSFVPAEDDTFYALWKVKAVLTVVYNNGEANGEFTYSVGDIATVEMPVYAKHAFVGWYVSETFAEGTEWTSGTEIADHLTIYAKWEDAPAFYNTYTITRLVNYSSYSTRYGDMYFYKSYSTGAYTFNIDAYGNGVGTDSPFSGEFIIQNYNKETGYLEINHKGSIYPGYLDSETGIIVTKYVASHEGLNQVFFFNPLTTEEVSSSQVSQSYWNTGFSRAVQYTYNGTTYSFFVHNNVVYFNVNFTNANGEAITGVECYQASTLYVKDANGNLIAEFAHDGSSLQPMDGFQGTYAVEGGEIVVDGVKTITINGVAGTYTKAAEGATYTHDAYVGGCYYEVTLNKDNYTAVVNKPMVTINFVSDYAEVASITTNKNIAITLAEPESATHIFRAWYSDSEYVNVVDNNYVPTSDITLYAKWDAKVTLTVVYGNGLEDAVIYYGEGDTVAPEEPAFTNGKVFNGWYSDADCTEAYEIGAIEENMTIYCNWMDAVAAYGSYSGFNLYGDGSKNTTSFSTKLTIAPDGTVSGKRSGTFTDYDENTGVAKIENGSKVWYTYYNAELGIIAFAYNSSGNAASLEDDMYLLFKETPVSVAQSAKLTSSGFTKLLKVVNTDGTSYCVLVMNDKIQLVSSWEVLEGSASNEKEIGNATKFMVYMASGDVAYEFTKNGSYFDVTEKSLKVAAGTYIGISVSGSKETAATTTAYDNFKLVVDENSKTTEKKSGEIKDYDPKTGFFKLYTSATSYNYGYYNADLGILMYAGSAKKDTFGYNYCVYFLGATTATVKGSSSYWNNGLTRIMDITVDGVVRRAFMYNDVLYMDVTYASSTADVTAANAYTASDFTVYDSEGNEIAKFVNNGIALVEKTDGLEGTYAVEGGEIVVDGFGSITIGGVVGTYTMAKEGSAHTIDAVVGESRYEVTLNKETLTAIVAEVKVLVSVTSTGSYAWTYSSATNEFVSGNKGKHNTTSTLTITAKGAVTITFKYNARTEAGYDLMYIKVDGSEEESASGARYNQYVEYTVELNAGEVLTIEFTKDDSDYYDVGSDAVSIKDLAANGVAINGFVE